MLSWIAGLLMAAASATTAADSPIRAGDTPPPFLGTNLDGDEIATSQYAGKILVVTFWASWCGPCKKELPLLEGIQRVAGKDRVQVVAINIEDREVYRKLARGLKSGFTLSINHDTGKKASEAYGVHGIPHLVLIGRDGKVIAVHRGYSDEGIDAIIAEINRALAG
jgi:thiol-disulfide isomerase/thioredoxin